MGTFLLGLAPGGGAQFVVFETTLSLEERKVAIVADVRVTVTSQTPWGAYSQTESGKYWRSRDGKMRRDDSFRNSVIVDLRARTMAMIDHDLKIARVHQVVDARLPKATLRPVPPGRIYDDPAGLNPLLLSMPPKLKKIGDKQIDGWRVTGRRWEGDSKDNQWGRDAEGWTYEVWTANDLKLAVLFKYNTSLTETVQRFENIQMREPDPELFKIPKGYLVKKVYSGYGLGSPFPTETGIQK